MKKIMFTICIVLFSIAVNAQAHTLEKLWETDSVVAVPESVLPAKDLLYVALINGGAWAADGIGGVGKLTLDGKIIDSSWITGLNAPKGMGIHAEKLYVADISEVIVINLKTGKIERKIPVDSAKALNDITITANGIVYVSDSRTAKIWRLENDIPRLFLDSMKGVNGLKAVGNDLYIGSGKLFLKADQAKQITRIAELPQGIDGIEPVGNGDFLLSAWAGYIWYVYADGKIETLLETHGQKKNTADIGYDKEKRILYVPTFNAKTIVAFQLR